jgi:hypothetical protein
MGFKWQMLYNSIDEKESLTGSGMSIREKNIDK